MELCCDEEDTGNYLSDRKKQGQALFESVMHGKNTNNKNGLCEKRLDNYDELQREIDDKCFERENAMKESREKMVIFKRAARAYARIIQATISTPRLPHTGVCATAILEKMPAAIRKNITEKSLMRLWSNFKATRKLARSNLRTLQ